MGVCVCVFSPVRFEDDFLSHFLAVLRPRHHLLPCPRLGTALVELLLALPSLLCHRLLESTRTIDSCKLTHSYCLMPKLTPSQTCAMVHDRATHQAILSQNWCSRSSPIAIAGLVLECSGRPGKLGPRRLLSMVRIVRHQQQLLVIVLLGLQCLLDGSQLVVERDALVLESLRDLLIGLPDGLGLVVLDDGLVQSVLQGADPACERVLRINKFGASLASLATK